ncbi:MAG: CoxE, partial [Solirubrobacterales bacterium]
MAAKLLGFCEELRGEGVAVGTSEMLDAFAALSEVDWTSRADFREALAATIAKSQDDRRVFELLFERYFFRTAEA